MGEKKAIALEKQYRKEISKGASSAIASKIGNISIYKEFEPWTYDWLHKQKIHARNTMITSAVLIAVGTVVGALSFLAPDNTESGTAPGVEAAISIISLFVGGGGVALIVSGGMYAVHSTRISKFHFKEAPVPVPGEFATITDSDMMVLQTCRDAQPFEQRASWTQEVTGTIIYDDKGNEPLIHFNRGPIRTIE